MNDPPNNRSAISAWYLCFVLSGPSALAYGVSPFAAMAREAGFEPATLGPSGHQSSTYELTLAVLTTTVTSRRKRFLLAGR